VLMEQKNDMQLAFDEMMEDISSGVRKFKVYRQMKMYNDASLNPALYGTKGHS
jgi:ribosome-associated translation inhibitor RaiA